MTDSLSNDVIVRAQRGNPEATGAIYARYHQSIFRYLYYRTGDPQTAEDLTADVFLKMVQALPSYRIATTPFQAWLFQVARNLAIDHHRRSSAHPVVAIDENLDAEHDLDSVIDEKFSSVDLAQALSKIEDTQQDVLLLRFIDGMSIAEAAQVLHKSEDAVKALQRRGLLALRALLDHQEV
jgi:RNA polymerase sigma-70 factor (ECF subfamily)